MNKNQNDFNKWYHFGRWIEPILSVSFWLDISFKELGFDFITVIKDLDGHYFLLKKDLDKVTVFVEDKIKNNVEWFKKLFSLCDKKAEKVLIFKNKKDINQFFEVAARCLNCSMVIELVDYGLERYLEKISQKTGIQVGEILSFIKPHKKTPIMKFQDKLRKIKKQDIPKFIKKYEWVGTHMFMGKGLNERKLKKEILNIDKKPDSPSKKISDLPKEYKNIINIGSKLAFYRSYLVETVDGVAYYYWPDIKRIAKENGLTWNNMMLLTRKELIEFNNKKILPEKYKKRKNGFGVMNVNNKIVVVTGNELQKELNECQERIPREDITELKGMVACKGKVKGIVKIIEEAKNISKVKKGEILVANETTPDYAVGMKIAGAIVTNQGGITSHAAIISRELNIPCIIGTRIATKVLKDGQLVEVDADKGVVRVIR